MIESHWNYFLAIEDDLERLSRHIEFDERNFKCFTIEISRILLASATADNIHQYRDEIKVAG